jgi:hypothetical protein
MRLGSIAVPIRRDYTCFRRCRGEFLTCKLAFQSLEALEILFLPNAVIALRSVFACLAVGAVSQIVPEGTGNLIASTPLAKLFRGDGEHLL